MNHYLATYVRKGHLALVNGRHIFEAHRLCSLENFIDIIQRGAGVILDKGRTNTFRLGYTVQKLEVYYAIATIYDGDQLWRPLPKPQKANACAIFRKYLRAMGITIADDGVLISPSSEADLQIVSSPTSHPCHLVNPTVLQVVCGLSRWFPEPEMTRFGHLSLNTVTGKMGNITVPPQPARVLEMLMLAGTTWMTRADLAFRVWGDRSMYTVSNLGACVHKLRSLGIEIETQRRKGYRLCL